MSDFAIESLGPRTIPSPLRQGPSAFVTERARVALDVETEEGHPFRPQFAERAGARAQIHFDPARTRAGIVTCGGLCPGINDVVRSLVLELHHAYGVGEVLGFRYGFEGLVAGAGEEPVRLGPEEVRTIHLRGGSVLGVSRGAQSVTAMADTLLRREVDLLFAVGGDGTLRGARALGAELARRGARIAIVGVPKTIDNDIPFVDKTFGYDTAVEHARHAIDSAHAEATSARNGIGLVRLMGRDSGFIAAAATLASDDVNVCLVPEVPFELEGDDGLLAALERRLAARAHAVIVVAEGCGASLVGGRPERDPSGHVRYASSEADVGPWLRDVVSQHFKGRRVPVTLKYIDPSYMIRSCRANAADAILADGLARHAVHAAMAGKTSVMIGRVHGVFTHIPIDRAADAAKRIDPQGPLWLSVLEATGQPALVGDVG